VRARCGLQKRRPQLDRVGDIDVFGGRHYRHAPDHLNREAGVGRHGTLRIWTEPERLVCEVTDTGHISDPLAGRRLSSTAHESGNGLRVVHQVCDFVEVRSGSFGTNIRVYRDLT
jgi:hypothetical protein